MSSTSPVLDTKRGGGQWVDVLFGGALGLNMLLVPLAIVVPRLDSAAGAATLVAAAVGLGLRLWIAGLLLWLIGHGLAVWAARRDPLFVEVVRRHLRIPGRLGV